MLITFLWKFNVAWKSIPFCPMQLCEVLLWRCYFCTSFIILLWTNFLRCKMHGLWFQSSVFQVWREGRMSKIKSFTCFSNFDRKCFQVLWAICHFLYLSYACYLRIYVWQLSFPAPYTGRKWEVESDILLNSCFYYAASVQWAKSYSTGQKW
mgnify:CR=1 FL=1